MLGFWEPSNCRRPGAALENPTDFGDETLFDKVEFGVKFDGVSIDGALTFGPSIDVASVVEFELGAIFGDPPLGE